MDPFAKKLIRILIAVLVMLWAAVFISGTVHARAQRDAGAELPIQPSGLTAAALPPPAEQDQCLHCHISGSDESLWTPLTRWGAFGIAGLVFVFGMAQSAWIWKNRARWVPITTRMGDWVNERYQTKEVMEKVLNKPVPLWATRWWYCLGGITALLFVVQAITGIMLAFYYQPTPDAAYTSIQYIETSVRFGAGVRAIHHWSANGMIVMVFAHMLRVFIMGAFKAPRELNWMSGVILFITTLAFGFTGYLLPWDQRAYWATTVGSEIAGAIPSIGQLVLVFLRVGWDITAVTLSRFYALHVIVLPILILVVMLMHFLMVRRQGLKEPL